MTDVRRRAQPLRADDPPAPAAADDGAEFTIDHDAVDASVRDHTPEDRRRFADAVRGLRTGTSLNLSERTLMVLGGVIAPLGLLLVLLGWVGASRTPNLFEQIPYLISGGLLGLGLVFLGAFFYFAHWMTELVKEHRTQSAALLDAVEQLRDQIASGSNDVGRSADGRASAPPPAGERTLVATMNGSMVHRPDCVVVAGKNGLRQVSPDEPLAPCKLCDPLGEAPSAN